MVCVGKRNRLHIYGTMDGRQRSMKTAKAHNDQMTGAIEFYPDPHYLRGKKFTHCRFCDKIARENVGLGGEHHKPQVCHYHGEEIRALQMRDLNQHIDGDGE